MSAGAGDGARRRADVRGRLSATATSYAAAARRRRPPPSLPGSVAAKARRVCDDDVHSPCASPPSPYPLPPSLLHPCALTRDALPSAVAKHKHVHVAKGERQLLSLARADQMLR